MGSAGGEAPRRANSRAAVSVGRVAIALVFLALSAKWAVEMHAAMLQDLDVYLAASRDIIAGHDPYAPRAALPYTYPPVWAVLCVPLALVPVWLAKTVVFVSTLAIAVVLVWRLSRGMARPWLWVGAAMFAAPISRTLYQGQVNLLVAGLVLLDYLVLSTRVRGVGTGLAAAIKVTPAFMALPMLLRKDWAGVARAAGSFLVVTAAAFAIWPGLSRRYWTELVWDSSRVGGVAYADNQSLLGALSRVFAPDTATRLWLVAALPVLALTVWAVRRQARGGNGLGEVAAAGIGASLLSPISWSHHWVWLILASAVIVSWGRERLALVVLVPLVVEPGFISGLLPADPPRLVSGIVLGLTPAVALGCLALLARARPPVPERPDYREGARPETAVTAATPTRASQG